MRRISSYAISLILPAALLCFLSSCAKAETEGPLSKISRIWSICPQNMAYVKAANICMDIYEYPNASGEAPLGGVNWKEAEELCRKNDKRLPSLKEWESACGGQEGRLYPYGNEYKAGTCQVDLKPNDKPAPSRSKRKCRSPEGIYDLSGNVWEWTSSPGFAHGTYYVKGGSWSSFPSVATCNLKAWEKPDGGGADYGFRCVSKPH